MEEMIELRRKARGMAVRERLIEAACVCMAARGYEACSVAELATAAQLSKNQLFYHFGSKEGLGLAAAERMARAWRDDIAAPAQIYPAPRERLRYMLARLAELSAAGWPHDRLLAALALGGEALPPELRARVTEAAAELRRAFSTPIKELRGDDTAELPGAQVPAGLRPRRLAAVIVSLIIGSAAGRGLGEPFGDNPACLAAIEQLLGLPAVIE